MCRAQIPSTTAHLPPTADSLGRGEGRSALPPAASPAPPHPACLPASQATCRAGPNPTQGGGEARCRPGSGESHLGDSREHLVCLCLFRATESTDQGGAHADCDYDLASSHPDLTRRGSTYPRLPGQAFPTSEGEQGMESKPRPSSPSHRLHKHLWSAGPTLRPGSTHPTETRGCPQSQHGTPSAPVQPTSPGSAEMATQGTVVVYDNHPDGVSPAAK